MEVLGTSFNVNGRKNKTRIVLNSGKVKLNLNQYDQNQKSELTMKPGELVEFDQQSNQLLKLEVDPEVYTSK